MAEKMSKREKEFSGKLPCGHCDNEAPMEVVAQYRKDRSSVDSQTGQTWDAAVFYQTLLCPACRDVNFLRFDYAEGFEDDPDPGTIVYPVSATKIPGLPERLDCEFVAATKVRAISPNAYGVLMGRLLELVCEDKKAAPGKLSARLKDLATKNVIPERLVEVATSLQRLRHVGAHANLGELTEEELPILEKLGRAVLEYVYVAPHLVTEAEDSLVKLQKTQRLHKGRPDKMKDV